MAWYVVCYCRGLRPLVWLKKKLGLKRHVLPHRWTSKTLGWIKEARLRDNIKYDHCEFGFDEKFSNIFHGILSHEQNRKLWTIAVKRTLIGSQIPWISRDYLPPLSSSTLSTTSLLSLTLDFPSLFPPVFLLLFPQLYLFIQVTIVIVEKHHKKFKLDIYIAGLFQTCWGCFLLLTLQICHIVHLWCPFFKKINFISF